MPQSSVGRGRPAVAPSPPVPAPSARGWPPAAAAIRCRAVASRATAEWSCALAAGAAVASASAASVLCPRVGRRRRPLPAASAMVAAPSTSSHTVGGPSARHVLALTAKQRETRHACIILQDLEWVGGRWGVSQRTTGLAAVLARSWKVRLQFLQWRRAAPECAGRVGTTPAKSCGKKRPPNRHDAGWRVAAARRAPLEGLPEGGPGDVRHVPTRCAARGRRRRARRRSEN